MALQQFPSSSKTLTIETSENKTVTSITYAYVYIPARINNLTFLLLHGFPSSSYDWRHQIRDLSASGYGVLAPDLLGYGDTDKPQAKEEYALKPMCAHIARLLDNEGLEKVVGVGHDWGCGLLSRFANYRQQYLTAAVFIAVPYIAPGPFKLDEFNEQTEKRFGYPIYGYQKFFSEPDAAKVIEKNHDSFISLQYPSDPSIWKYSMGPLNKAKEFITTNKKAPLPAWLPEQENTIHSNILLKGGYSAPLLWYKACHAIIEKDNWATIAQENLTLKIPVLFILAEFDFVCRPEIGYQIAEDLKKEGKLPDLQVTQVACGHWLQLERPREVFEILDGFARGVAKVKEK